MKKLILLLTLTFPFYSLAKKNALYFDPRFDYVSADNDEGNTGNPSFEAFQATEARLDYKGALTDKYSFRIRYNFRKTGVPNAVDKTAIALEKAIITTKLSDNIKLKIGKDLMAGGGREYDYNSADVYQFSLVGNALPSYELGATLYYHFLNQQVGIQLTNSDKSISTSSKNKQRNITRTIFWYGYLFNDFLKPIFSYSEVPKSGTHKKDFYLALGNQFSFLNVLLDLDYLLATTNDGNNIPTTSKSLVAQLVYQGEHFRPLFKIFLDENEKSHVKQFDSTGFDVAIQYYPESDKNFRYHLAYTYNNKKSKTTGVNSAKTSQIFLGIRAYLSIFEF